MDKNSLHVNNIRFAKVDKGRGVGGGSVCICISNLAKQTLMPP